MEWPVKGERVMGRAEWDVYGIYQISEIIVNSSVFIPLYIGHKRFKWNYCEVVRPPLRMFKSE